MPNATLSWVLQNEQWRARLLGMTIGGMLVLITVATVLLFTRQEPPWFQFNTLVAEYVPEEQSIYVSGTYTLTRLCPDADRNMTIRRELIDNSYRVSTTAVRLDQLALEVGTHKYQDVIKLTEPLSPEGWSVRVFTLCAGELPPQVSPDVVVNVRRP